MTTKSFSVLGSSKNFLTVSWLRRKFFKSWIIRIVILSFNFFMFGVRTRKESNLRPLPTLQGYDCIIILVDRSLWIWDLNNKNARLWLFYLSLHYLTHHSLINKIPNSDLSQRGLILMKSVGVEKYHVTAVYAPLFYHSST